MIKKNPIIMTFLDVVCTSPGGVLLLFSLYFVYKIAQMLYRDHDTDVRVFGAMGAVMLLVGAWWVSWRLHMSLTFLTVDKVFFYPVATYVLIGTIIFVCTAFYYGKKPSKKYKSPA